MKILAFILVVSIMFGGFSYTNTRDFITNKLYEVNEALNEVSGLLGDGDGLRIDGYNGTLVDESIYLYNAGEHMTVKQALRYQMGTYEKIYAKADDGESVEINYNPDFDFDSVYDTIYYLNIKWGIDDKYIKVPCVRVQSKGTDYLLIDPINYIPYGIEQRYSVWVQYGWTLLQKPKYCEVDTNLVQIRGTELYLMSLDSRWYDEYRDGLNLENIVEFFNPATPMKYVQTFKLDGYISNSTITVKEYLELGVF